MAEMDRGDLIYMFPGQGAQERKMCMDVHKKYERAKQIWDIASDIYGDDLVDICKNRPFREMQLTDRAQMLINTCNIVMYELAKAEGVVPDIVMGHSAGELSALYAADAVGLEDILYLVKCRGKFMYESAASSSGKMIAVKNLDTFKVQSKINECQRFGTICLANHNSASQCVVSGDVEVVKQFEQEICNDSECEIIDLKQQGAWHSPHMEEAKLRFRQELSKIRVSAPKIPIILNYSADFVTTSKEIRYQLTEILTSTVNWYTSLKKIYDIYKPLDCPVPTFAEMGPNKILRGLLRKSFQHLSFVDYEILNVNDSLSLERMINKMTKKQRTSIAV